MFTFNHGMSCKQVWHHDQHGLVRLHLPPACPVSDKLMQFLECSCDSAMDFTVCDLSPNESEVDFILFLRWCHIPRKYPKCSIWIEPVSERVSYILLKSGSQLAEQVIVTCFSVSCISPSEGHIVWGHEHWAAWTLFERRRKMVQYYSYCWLESDVIF